MIKQVGHSIQMRKSRPKLKSNRSLLISTWLKSTEEISNLNPKLILSRRANRIKMMGMKTIRRTQTSFLTPGWKMKVIKNNLKLKSNLTSLSSKALMKTLRRQVKMLRSTARKPQIKMSPKNSNKKKSTKKS